MTDKITQKKTLSGFSHDGVVAKAMVMLNNGWKVYKPAYINFLGKTKIKLKRELRPNHPDLSIMRDIETVTSIHYLYDQLKGINIEWKHNHHKVYGSTLVLTKDLQKYTVICGDLYDR